MPAPPSAESLFLDNLPLVERLAGAIARRQGIRGAEVEDFVASVKLRLVEDDYAVLRKFRGESSLTTYLAVVIAMLAREQRVQQTGRWRPSAVARRLGAVAVRLEMLIHRDRCSFVQASQTLLSRGEAEDEGELRRLHRALPRRLPLRPDAAGPEALAGTPDLGSADDDLARAEAERRRQQVDAALARAVAQLPDEDRVIVRLRYWEGLTIADVARALGLQQRPLYRRLERCLRELRDRLEAGGMGPADVAALLDETLPQSDDDSGAGWQDGGARPSTMATQEGD